MEVHDENDQGAREYAGIHEGQVGRATDARLPGERRYPGGLRA